MFFLYKEVRGGTRKSSFLVNNGDRSLKGFFELESKDQIQDATRRYRL